MKRLSLIIIILSATTAQASDMRDEDWMRTYIFTGTVVADLVTTRMLLDNGGIERNPVLGKRPSNQMLVTAGALAIAIHVALVEYMPLQWRAPFQWFTIGMESGFALHNLRVAGVINF